MLETGIMFDINIFNVCIVFCKGFAPEVAVEPKVGCLNQKWQGLTGFTYRTRQ